MALSGLIDKSETLREENEALEFEVATLERDNWIWKKKENDMLFVNEQLRQRLDELQGRIKTE